MEAPILIVGVALLAGVLAGFLPGMHPNSIGAIMIEVFGNAPWIPVALIALLGAHTAVEFFSSIFMGVPEGDTAAGTLPGARMMREGRGREAAIVVASSILFATALSIALTPAASALMPEIMEAVEPNTLALLGIAVLFLLASERKPAKIWKAILVFVLSAGLGQLAFATQMRDVLFPMFVGFFTLPGILLNENEGLAGVKQKQAKVEIDFVLPVLAGVALGGLADFLPGISTPAQIAVFATLFFPLGEPRKFLALVSSIAASHTVFAITAVDAIGKARVGAVALANSVEPITSGNLPMLLFAYLAATGIGVLALLAASKWACGKVGGLDFALAGKMLAGYLVLAVLLVCGAEGLLVLFTATAIGCLPIFFGVRRTHVMGGIIGPSMLRLV